MLKSFLLQLNPLCGLFLVSFWWISPSNFLHKLFFIYHHKISIGEQEEQAVCLQVTIHCVACFIPHPARERTLPTKTSQLSNYLWCIMFNLPVALECFPHLRTSR